MLRNVKSLAGFKIHATDGYIGKADDFFFDENTWTIRYLIVDTGPWLVGRKVMVYTAAIDKPDWDREEFLLNVSQEKVKNSPDIDVKRPISREQQMQLHSYYQWPGYAYLHFPAPDIVPPPPPTPQMPPQFPPEDQEQSHLRSAEEVKGYHIQATDGEIGHVEDFLVDDESWVLRYLIVDTRNWLPGKKVLIAPEWIQDIIWHDQKVFVELEKDAVKDSPKYEPGFMVDREFEKNLYVFYGVPAYWQ